MDRGDWDWQEWRREGGSHKFKDSGQFPKAARGREWILPSSLQKLRILAGFGAHDCETTYFGCLKSLGLWSFDTDEINFNHPFYLTQEPQSIIVSTQHWDKTLWVRGLMRWLSRGERPLLPSPKPEVDLWYSCGGGENWLSQIVFLPLHAYGGTESRSTSHRK